MKNKIFTATFLGLLFGFSALSNAQEAILTSGGDATGTGGSSSYSVGQLAYTYMDDTTTGTGSVLQGVQQPTEISETLGIDELITNFSIMVYPNPTTDFLNLQVDNGKTPLSYQLYDVSGRLLKNKKMTTNTTRIDMNGLANAVYFLKVIQENGRVKTFKIIKN